MTNVEEATVQKIVRTYRNVVGSPTFDEMWDGPIAVEQLLEQLRGGSSPFRLPGNSRIAKASSASANYVCRKVFSNLLKEFMCLTSDAQLQVTDQIGAYLDMRLADLRKSLRARDRAYLRTVLVYPPSTFADKPSRQAVQCKEFLRRLEGGLERGDGILVPLVLLPSGDYGRWLNDPRKQFTYHQCLDFLVCCDVVTRGARQRLARGLPFVRLRFKDFSVAMTILSTSPSVHLVYPPNVEVPVP